VLGVVVGGVGWGGWLVVRCGCGVVLGGGGRGGGGVGMVWVVRGVVG